MNMTKLEVQARVLSNGKPLDLDLFSWNKKTKTFSSGEDGLTLDFKNIDKVVFKTGSGCTFKTGLGCTFKTGSGCIFKTSHDCTFKTNSYCTFNTGSYCTFKTDSGCTFDTESYCTFKTDSGCTFDTDSYCTFDTNSSCTFKTGRDCTFKTSSGCTFNTESHCTFKTSHDCTFNTGYDCIFDTDSDCTFKTDSYCIFKTGLRCIFNTEAYCTFNTGSDCTFSIYYNAYIYNLEKNNVVVIRYVNKKTIYDLDTMSKSFLALYVNNAIEKEIKDVEMVDGSVMVKLSSEKKVDDITVLKAQYIIKYFNNSKETVIIAKSGKLTAHGVDIKDAIKNVIFKQQYKLGAEENAKRVVASGKVTMHDYRLLTGSCESGTKKFLDEHSIAYDTVMSIKDTIKLVKTQQAYRYEVFIENLKKAGYEE